MVVRPYSVCKHTHPLPLPSSAGSQRRSAGSSLEQRQEAEAQHKGDPFGAITHCETDDGWHTHVLTLVILLL